MPFEAMNLQGGKELDRKLKTLGTKVGKKVVRTAVRAGAKVELEVSKANATSMVGGDMGSLIAKNLAVRAFKKQRKGSYGVSTIIKPNDKFVYIAKVHSKYPGGRTYIPAAIEFGHDNARPIPFRRNAADSTKNKRVQVIGVKLKEGIEAIAKVG